MTAAEAPAEPDDLVRIWHGYARNVYGSYSPLNAALAKVVAGSPAILEFLRRQPPHAQDPNMLLAAIQFLVLGGADHPLASRYGPAATPAGPGQLAQELESFCASFEADLSPILAERRIQTNEVGRSPGLALGLACAARLIGEPLALVDAGASAGLNLLMDDYRLVYSERAEVGSARSAVRIDCRVQPDNLRLPDRLPVISRRVGLDRSPVDLTRPDNVRWLLACIWPGTGRQERAAEAMKLAVKRPPRMLKGDMVLDLREVIRGMRPGPVAVVTSWSFSYLSARDRRLFEQALGEAGQDEPVAWVCCDSAGVTDLFQPREPPPDDHDIPSVLGLAVFRGGDVDSRCLAYMHSHGSWVKWLDDSLAPQWP